MKRVPDLPHGESRAAVLRDVVLQSQPHALARPVQRLLVVSSQGQAPGPAHDARVQPPAAEPPRPNYEDGFADGHEQGHAEGLAAAARQSVREHEEAREEERRLAAEAGRRDGHAEGLAQAAQENSQALQDALDALRGEQGERTQRLERMLGAFREEFARRLEAQEDDMVALCHEVVCRMLGEAAAAPQAIRAMLGQARAQMPGQGQGELEVHLHPDDRRAVGEFAALDGLAGVQWVADPEVVLGGVWLRSPQGSIDARLEVQMDNLKQALLSARAQRRLAAASAGAQP